MKVTKLTPNKKVEWKCIDSIEEWVGTDISFDMEEKQGSTIIHFTHAGLRATTDTFAGCTHDWAFFMKRLKSLWQPELEPLLGNNNSLIYKKI